MRVNVYILLIVKLYKTNVLISLYQHVLSILNNLKKNVKFYHSRTNFVQYVLYKLFQSYNDEMVTVKYHI